MTQQCALQHSELKMLIEQLHLSLERSEQILDRLCDLSINSAHPGLNAGQQETSLAGQEHTPCHQIQDTVLSPSLPVPVSTNAYMRIAIELACSMAEMDASVLIQGATGTGKNLIARLIHARGNRSQHPLVTLPCRLYNYPDGLEHIMERLDEASNGSLILEDIDELQPAAQAHLKNLLQQPVACRLISLTCKDPDKLVSQGILSATLLDQLRDCHISLPNLADRNKDIELLARYYCRLLCNNVGTPEKQLSPEYLELLHLYCWPGNVRELINTLKQSLLSAGAQKTLYAKDLPVHIRIQTLHQSSTRKKGL